MVFAVGCKKNKGEETTPAATTTGLMGQQDKPASDQKTEVATGEMRELLLTLQRVHFPLDSTTLGDEAKSVLDEASKKLIEHPEVALYVDGHTDERGTAEHNMALAERRSKAVIDYLSHLGVPSERLAPVSHGKEDPMATGSTVEALAKNRRVEFRLMKGDVQLVLEPGTLVDDQGNRLAPPVQD
jgi:peptidoglycan-associated lipoprotein